MNRIHERETDLLWVDDDGGHENFILGKLGRKK